MVEVDVQLDREKVRIVFLLLGYTMQLGGCFFVSLFCFAMTAGCGGGDFPTVQTTGVVLCEGVPVEGAMVYFEPIRGQGTTQGNAIIGKQGFSWTDADSRCRCGRR